MTDPALSIATQFIAGFESFRSKPYLDQANVPTIGFGFTYSSDGSPVTMSTSAIGLDDAIVRLSSMVASVLKLVRGMVHVSMTDNQAAAMTSFAFNCGTNALRGSGLLRLFETGEVKNAALQFGAWVHAGGQVSAGLVRRRKAEADLFLKPDEDVPVSAPCIQTSDIPVNGDDYATV